MSDRNNGAIDMACDGLKELLSERSDTYSSKGEFQNFELAAGLAGLKPEEVMLGQIGIKIARIQNLRSMGVRLTSDRLLDSYKDLAGYAIILFAYALAEGVSDA